MPLWRYVKEGVAFTPEQLSAIGEAFKAVVADLGIGPEEETKREAVAHFIIDYVQADSSYYGSSEKRVDANRIREATVTTLSEFVKGGTISDRDRPSGRP